MTRSTARRPLAFRPTACTAAYMRPYALAARASNGRGVNVASTSCNRSCLRDLSITSLVACGPAANSARLIAAIAISSGRFVASIRSNCTNTDVSMSPRTCLGTRLHAGAGERVEILPQPLEINGGRSAKRRNGCVRRHKVPSQQWRQLANRYPVSRYDKGTAGVQLAHDGTAVVPQRPLRYFTWHSHSVARVLRNSQS
jgi:hypothetical protein